jgi:hypothetical protein
LGLFSNSDPMLLAWHFPVCLVEESQPNCHRQNYNSAWASLHLLCQITRHSYVTHKINQWWLFIILNSQRPVSMRNIILPAIRCPKLLVRMFQQLSAKWLHCDKVQTFWRHGTVYTNLFIFSNISKNKQKSGTDMERGCKICCNPNYFEAAVWGRVIYPQKCTLFINSRLKTAVIIL